MVHTIVYEYSFTDVMFGFHYCNACVVSIECDFGRILLFKYIVMI